ncbi:GNAT family N-acetyltransferase [Bosea sp. 2YAB26]|uniref:GNAT family N-acetyltransferase n=1 Tax=Bosea sp. 2YAB26 TaxID=3237478 RepID=UPI003F92D28E
MIIRDEQPADIPAIQALIGDAFKDAFHSNGAEAAIVDGLRRGGMLALSLVASDGEALLGHVAFSPVTIGGQELGWFGLGPLAVRPGMQGRGIGQALVRAGLDRLKTAGAKGCVLLGAPGYYARFGFAADPRLWLADVPQEYFQVLGFGGPLPAGEVRYHAAFDAGES